MVWVIRYIVDVLIKHDAWDRNSTHMQPIENTCKAKVPCMLISPKDQNLAMQWTSSTSALLWIFSRQLEHPRNTLFSHFTRVQANQKFQHTLHSFLLREELGSSLESFSCVHMFTHTKRKISLHLISYLTLSKQLQQSGNSLPYGPTPKRKKTLSSSLPLILLGPATRKGKSFHAREILFLFSPQEP